MRRVALTRRVAWRRRLPLQTGLQRKTGSQCGQRRGSSGSSEGHSGFSTWLGRCHRRAVVAAWRKHPVTNSPGVNLDVRSAPAGRARIPTGQIDSRFRHLGRQPLCAFAADAQELNLSHNLPQDCAVYTGTHDNAPSRGWFAQTAVCERDFARTYLRCDGLAS